MWGMKKAPQLCCVSCGACMTNDDERSIYFAAFSSVMLGSSRP